MATVPHASRQPGRPAASGPSRVVAARPLLWFFVLAYGLTWAWWLPLALAGQTVTQGDGWPTHFPGLLGPAAAAVLVTAATGGAAGVQELLGRIGRWRIGLGSPWSRPRSPDQVPAPKPLAAQPAFQPSYRGLSAVRTAVPPGHE